MSASILLTPEDIDDSDIILTGILPTVRKYDLRFNNITNNQRYFDLCNAISKSRGKKYNNVFVSDTDGEFALGVPNATMSPAIVSGSAGLTAKAWHWSYLRHDAPQLNGRFERMNNRRMKSKDWAAWISIKTIVESVLRIQNISNKNIIEYLKGSDLQVDGSKGIGLNFKNVKH